MQSCGSEDRGQNVRSTALEVVKVGDDGDAGSCGGPPGWAGRAL